MLVLSRKSGESIMIGDTVEIIILGEKGGNTRVGINAPIEIPVHRMEIYKKIKMQQQGQGVAQYISRKQDGSSGHK